MSGPSIQLTSPFGRASVSVDEGEMVVLTAPPGSGTSAALRALAGDAPIPEPGRAMVDGQELSLLSHRKKRRARQNLRLFHLPHDPPLISNLTVMENILLPARFLGENTEEQAAREGRLLLEAAALGWAAGMLPGRLPMEARKAVALIRGFLRRPRVALLDDPLADLDDVSLAGIRPLIRGTLAAGGCAILAASRDLRPFEGIPYRHVRMTPLRAPDAAGGKEPL